MSSLRISGMRSIRNSTVWGLGSHTSEAPRPETPCQVESGTVVSRNATRPCGGKSRRSLWGVACSWQPRHRGRCHACSRSWPQTRNVCCAPVCLGAQHDGEKSSVCVQCLSPFRIGSAVQCGSRSRSCEDGFKDRRFEQSRSLPILHLHLTHGEGRGLPTGNCHDQEIGAGRGGAAFDSGLIREGKGDSDHIPNVRTGHNRRQRGCPRPTQRRRWLTGWWRESDRPLWPDGGQENPRSLPPRLDIREEDAEVFVE